MLASFCTDIHADVSCNVRETLNMAPHRIDLLLFFPPAASGSGEVDVAISAVAGELLEKLGSRGAPLAEGLLLRLGEMCAGASDAAEEGADEASDKVSLAAQNALGQGIRSMGPSAVLAVLPLGLVEVFCSHSWPWQTLSMQPYL